ncbi:MAG: ABC transporter ATP-binding protein [Planctomycetaceae bacterium]
MTIRNLFDCGFSNLSAARCSSPLGLTTFLQWSITRNPDVEARLKIADADHNVPASLHCQELTVKFAGARAAVDDVTCEFEAGEITALVGKSGCGKTTLLRALARLQRPTTGAIRVEPPSDTAAGQMAFVFQQPTLLPWRSAVDNVILPLQLASHGDAKGLLQRRAAEELAAMGLGPDEIQRYPSELSGGMRMRVSLARALVTRPTVLLLDEPFAALDDMLRVALGDLLLQRWSERPFTMVLVTHNIAEAAMLSHRVMIMNAGKITHVLDNRLPWPRDEGVRTSVAFGEFYRQVSAELRRNR